MTDLLLFARLLRDAGLCVAPSEIADAFSGLRLLHEPGPGCLHYRILQACLVKQNEDQATFNTIYSLFFHNSPATVPGDTGANPTGQIAAAIGVTAGGLPSLAKAILSGNFTPCSNDLALAVTKACRHTVDIHEQVRQALVNLDYYSALNSLRLRTLQGQISEWEYAAAVDRHAADFVQTVEQEIIERRLALDHNWSEVTKHLNWKEKSFQLLNLLEMDLVKKHLQKIGRKLAVKPGVKRKTASTGQLNFRKTIAEAIAAGGPCIKLVYERRIPEKPELVLLCDVSNSVYQFTGFMLQLVAAFRQRFHKVQAFVFVDKLWRVPNQTLREDVSQALEDIRENNRCSITGLSDFGQVFSEFKAEVLPTLAAKTVLIILGDAKNNWRPLELHDFKQISARMYRVFWLNPISQELWGQEDCQIAEYEPFCSAVFECGNLSQLEHVARQIF